MTAEELARKLNKHCYISADNIDPVVDIIRAAEAEAYKRGVVDAIESLRKLLDNARPQK